MAKIAILYEILGRSKGGIEAWIYHASEELLRLGHDVTLISKQEEIPQDAAPKGIEFLTLQPHTKRPIIDLLFEIRSNIDQLRMTLINFDIVWTRSFKLAYAASKILGKNKVVFINAAPYSLYGQKRFAKKILEAKSFRQFLMALASEVHVKMAFFYEKKTVNYCKNVYLSKARMNETINFFRLKFHEENFYIVPAGVDSKLFKPSYKGFENIDLFKVISVCRLEYDKNIQCVISAVETLVKDGLNVNYTIIGTGSFEAQLKSLVFEKNLQEHIIFAGRQEMVEQWYIKNHVFVLPSLYEGFGSVYVEAMASGLPCIAISNKSGKYSVAADEIIDHEINGYLLTENDPQELSHYLKLLINDKDLLKSMSQSASEKAKNEYTWNNTINKILSITFL